MDIAKERFIIRGELIDPDERQPRVYYGTEFIYHRGVRSTHPGTDIVTALGPVSGEIAIEALRLPGLNEVEEPIVVHISYLNPITW
ncbi:unnamed protein product [Protopolystoma xenopodis]|uniref:Uncharacterized protein n=1 Tax=Protopolystoma xenopodis TaxID=117903 RepID=A0A3S5A3P4_9PLAT|nr:unnamed protein product [Protopolystoma xenopodis]